MKIKIEDDMSQKKRLLDLEPGEFFMVVGQGKSPIYLRLSLNEFGFGSALDMATYEVKHLHLTKTCVNPLRQIEALRLTWARQEF